MMTVLPIYVWMVETARIKSTLTHVNVLQDMKEQIVEQVSWTNRA